MKKIYLIHVIRWALALAIAVVIWHLWSRRVWTWELWNLATLAVAYAFALVILSSPEVFVIAFILAMIIRGFCVEVYKIPTGSMEPTLHGDPVSGDQILANKFSRYLEPIHRFDVILFRYPLNKTKNFIKRVVGLPDEGFMIKDGNIYYCPQASNPEKEQNEFYLAKKPLRVQESIWIPIWLWDKTRDLIKTFDEDFQTSGSKEWQDHKILLRSDDGSGENLINYREPFRVYYKTRRGTVYRQAPEFKLVFKCQPLGKLSNGAGEIKIQIEDGINTFILHLGLVADSSSSTPRTALVQGTPIPTGSFLEHINYKNESRSEPIEQLLQPHREYQVSLMNYDGTIYLKIDNKVILKYDYEVVLSDHGSFSRSTSDEMISFGVINTQALFSEINLYGDIYYEAKGRLREGTPINIPDGRYFVIGDNVGDSKDSRLWKMKRIYLKDGRVIECDNDSFRGESDYISIWRDRRRNKGGDIWGNECRVKRSEIDRMEEIYYPFIRDEEIFGKALLVYWPFWRMKIIR